MSAECYPITVLPHISLLYREYLAMGDAAADAPVRKWYGGNPFAGRWDARDVGVTHAEQLADSLQQQSVRFGAGPATLANIEKLRNGARAVVTGQQVGLFGGPLLTLLKAATAIARARQAAEATRVEHVPVFWLATEDHDLAEVDHIDLPGKYAVDTLSMGHLKFPSAAVPVGGIVLDGLIDSLLDQASELLAYAPICDLLRECYAPGATLGSAFAQLMTRVFAEHGLIVMDAAAPGFHSLGKAALRYAIEHADELQAGLRARSEELETAGFHAQVLVNDEASLLFLVNDPGEYEVHERRPLKRLPDGNWKAGRSTYSTTDLLRILETTPERISPNALLRPVFQDTILPTAAYVGGPAEIAYFAQSAVLYEAMLGRITPVLPRLSATLIEPAIAAVMDRHEVSLHDAMTTAESLAQRLGARAMPIEAKRKLAAAGNAMDAELSTLTAYMTAMNADLGRSANVAGNKMRYQMNRLRRMAATFELQKEASLRKHAEALTLHLFPNGHPQERVLGGVWFLAQDEGLVARLVREAENLCPGHFAIRL